MHPHNVLRWTNSIKGKLPYHLIAGTYVIADCRQQFIVDTNANPSYYVVAMIYHITSLPRPVFPLIQVVVAYADFHITVWYSIARLHG